MSLMIKILLLIGKYSNVFYMFVDRTVTTSLLLVMSYLIQSFINDGSNFSFTCVSLVDDDEV
ncbi:hypothetical protein BLOT_012636 [Blomia tropicalis]|nr:hypothetical protein BLOT_012636 [Blomia tropicalis]